MSYTINPNAKNKWARNAENTMDLSLETDASSVYLDNGRTLEQEIGEGSMVSNVATVDSGMEKVIDGTYDGAYESCVFKGKSLVNISNKTQEIELLGRVDTHAQIEIANKDLLKRNTKYILILSYDATFDTNSPNKTLYLDDGHGNTYIKGSTKRNIVTDSGKGVFVSVITTKDEEKTNNSNIHITLFKGSDGNRVIISNLMLIEYQEDMENWDIPYFEGICDVKMPILRNVGKNLFNPSLLLESETRFGITKNVVGETIVLNGTSNQYHDLHFTPNDNKTGIVVKKGKFYKLTIHCLGGTSTPVLNPAVKLTLEDGTIKWLGSNIDLRDSNCNGLLTWFRICPQEGNSFSNYQIKLQLEESSTSTSYESHKSNILETSNDLVLRGLPSGIRDTYDCLTGEYIRRVGERDYQESDESDSNVITDLVKTHYELAEPIVTQIEPPTTPFAYENGHIILESGHEGQTLLPTLEYSTVINRTGQIQSIANTVQKQEKQITKLEQMLIQNIIDLDYNNTLLTLKNEMEEML